MSLSPTAGASVESQILAAKRGVTASISHFSTCSVQCTRMLMLRKVSKPADGRRGLSVSQQLCVCELGTTARLSFQKHNILECGGSK